MKLKHNTCGYVWEYNGNAIALTSCPRCRGTVFIKRSTTKKPTTREVEAK